MIEKITGAQEDDPEGPDVATIFMDKINELIEASNRQDRAVGYMMLNHPKLWSELKRRAEENQTAANDLAYWESLRG